MKELNIKIIYLLLCIIFIGCHDSVDPKDSYNMFPNKLYPELLYYKN